MKMLLTAERIDAQEAFRIGLVSGVVRAGAVNGNGQENREYNCRKCSPFRAGSKKVADVGARPAGGTRPIMCDYLW